MNRIPLAKKAVALPLLGLLVAWMAFMGAALANLYVPQPIYNDAGVATFPEELVQVAPYLFLLGIASVSAASLLGKKLAQRSRQELGDGHKLSRAALRFANLGVVIGLAAGAIFAIGNFLGAFNTYSGRDENALLRLLNVYVPILLATGLVVYVLLAAFVFNHDAEKNSDGTKAKMSEAQKALAWLRNSNFGHRGCDNFWTWRIRRHRYKPSGLDLGIHYRDCGTRSCVWNPICQ